MLCRKFKRWGLLMSGLNVVLPWVVLRLLLGLIFRGCFVIDEILVFGKIRFRVTHIFRERNACADKLANLWFIHRKSFHWYCSRRLTLVRSSTSDLSHLESVIRLLVALERGSVEIEGVSPVDHTPTIKSVRAY